MLIYFPIGYRIVFHYFLLSKQKVAQKRMPGVLEKNIFQGE
jgi:hypothetical protein